MIEDTISTAICTINDVLRRHANTLAESGCDRDLEAVIVDLQLLEGQMEDQIEVAEMAAEKRLGDALNALWVFKEFYPRIDDDPQWTLGDRIDWQNAISLID